MGAETVTEMLRNRFEYRLMNNPLRAALLRHRESVFHTQSLANKSARIITAINRNVTTSNVCPGIISVPFVSSFHTVAIPLLIATGHDAAVHVPDRSRDPACLVRKQEDDRRRHVGCSPDTSKRVEIVEAL